MSEEIKDIVEQPVSTESVEDQWIAEEAVTKEAIGGVVAEEEDIEQLATESTDMSKQSRKEVSDESRNDNIKALRESRKQLQKERDDYLARIKQLEETQKANNLNAYDVDRTSTELFDEDSKVEKELKEIRQMRAEMSSNNSRMRLNTNYPDFNKIVNEESITILKQRYPEVAATLDMSKDMYTTGVSAYNIIKKFGLHIDDEVVEQRQKAEANINKPRPISTVKGQSPLSHVSDYSDLSDKKVRDEIIRIATERANG